MKDLSRGNVLTELNLHFAGVALLAVLNLFLLVRLVVAWHTIGAEQPEQTAALEIERRTLELQNRPLRGLGSKVELARSATADFYRQRIPANYSSILTDIDNVAVKNNVRLTRVQYTPAPAIEGLTELRLDASLSGEYPSIVRLINGLERDKTFFMINAITLTGQQGGLVNLRLRLVTYLRTADAAELARDTSTGADPAPVSNPADSSPMETQ